MNRAWIASQLTEYLISLNKLAQFDDASDDDEWQELARINSTPVVIIDHLVTIEPVMRDLMRAARADLAKYPEPGTYGWKIYDLTYWRVQVRPLVQRATGIMTLGVQAREMLRPDSPELSAEQFHPWVWEAAAPMWYAGSPREAVHAAARLLNARLQQKLARHDMADARLCREAFSTSDPAPGQPRLRFAGDRLSELWRSRQNGGIQLGAGCFEGIRNPVAHDHDLVLPEQIALEQLAALSVLARWIDDCTVEEAQVTQPELEAAVDPQAAITA